MEVGGISRALILDYLAMGQAYGGDTLVAAHVVHISLSA